MIEWAAATVLTRAAFDRGSRDNVTVVVIDLGIGGMDSEDSDEEARAPPRHPGSDADHEDLAAPSSHPSGSLASSHPSGSFAGEQPDSPRAHTGRAGHL